MPITGSFSIFEYINGIESKRPSAEQVAFFKPKDILSKVLQLEFDEIENVEGKAFK